MVSPPRRSTSGSPTRGLLAELEADGRLAHIEHFAPRSAEFRRLSRPLPPTVDLACSSAELWSHQAEAIDMIRDGHHVVVATGTAPGKSRCFQIPIVEAVLDPIKPATALVVTPTKALAHDQLRALAALAVPEVRPGAYDGDASREERAWVREHANVVFTNPEMLHGGLLPRHAKWDALLMRLRYVVIDELHVFRGVFGTHVAHVLRRLRRLCRHYGADPTFVFCSATIGDPARLAAALCGAPVTAVTRDGSPAGARAFALLDPPEIEPRTGTRASPNSESAAVAARLIEDGRRTITFCRSRKGTELVAADIDRRLARDGEAGAVVAYRAGYLPEERRAIEHDLADGTLRGVVSTSALELGIDIGGLDACVLNGFPGTIASMWQQAARRAADHRLDRRPGGWRRPARPVLHASSRRVVQPVPGAVGDQHRQPLHPRAPPRLRGLRAAAHLRRHPLVVRRGAPRRRPRTRARRSAPLPAHGAGTARRSRSPTGAAPASRARGVGLRTGSASEVRIVDHHSDRLIGTIDESRVSTRCTKAPSTCTAGRPSK
ncbi:MAG: DEAD/DEAH box helicase [Acidimicrobiales bacterium]